ncbi:MAG: cytochrome c biogenesis protein ResB [Desulfobacterales bacterium]|nr:cytochrome c biogenesis protein ResB [Desulfobacterales bacterium]
MAGGDALAILNRLVSFFASVRLTVVVLLSLAVTSIIGTVIPQNEAPEGYVQAFGPRGYRFLEALDLVDMYHAWWFQLLLLLLVVNIVVCSVERLRASWTIIFTRSPRYRLERFRKSAVQTEFKVDAAPEVLRQTVRTVLGKGFKRRATLAGEDGIEGDCAERWRWSRLGVYIVHLSVVMLVAGGMIGGLFGFEGYVNIPEGEATDTISLRDGSGTRQLPFAIRCNDFSLSVYPNGAPKEYRSSISLLRDGQVIEEKEIIVNDPLRFEGINIFQSSYGKLPPPLPAEGAGPPERLAVHVLSNHSGRSYHEEGAIGDQLDLPEGLGTLRLDAYRPDSQFMGQPLGPAVEATLVHPGQAPIKLTLPLRFAAFDRMRRGQVVVAVTSAIPMPERYYTGLQVTRDPGVGTVYVAFAVMIIGCLVTFFMSHQQVCATVRPRGRQGSTVVVYGITNRNKMAMQRQVDLLARRIAAAAGGPDGA